MRIVLRNGHRVHFFIHCQNYMILPLGLSLFWGLNCGHRRVPASWCRMIRFVLLYADHNKDVLQFVMSFLSTSKVDDSLDVKYAPIYLGYILFTTLPRNITIICRIYSKCKWKGNALCVVHFMTQIRRMSKKEQLIKIKHTFHKVNIPTLYLFRFFKH